jgi:hypothetical protein
MTPRRVLTHEIENGAIQIRVELEVGDTELSMTISASVEIAFCLRILGHRHCFEISPHLPMTLLEIDAGTRCTAYIKRGDRLFEVPISEVLTILGNVELPILWPEGEDAIKSFTSKC